jgi:hypothetical protein
MSLYLLKPIVWNENGYLRPGGGKFFSGYPKENGFGHEEWNAAPHLEYEEDGRRWRSFHTEKVSDARLTASAGDIVVFMIASHQREQFVVGIAGNATNLVEATAERRRLVKILGTNSTTRADEAWALPQVKGCFDNDRAAFQKQWAEESQWAPTWRCPSESFLWLDKPIKLDAVALSGKSRLVTMYSTYQPIERSQAEQIFMQIARAGYRHPVLDGLDAACGSDHSEAEEDIDEVRNRSDKTTSPTSKLALIEARRGQGKFRAALCNKWGGCSVTGCTNETVLRASHIKPWRHATDAERLDPANGLLLVANLDALFDSGKISFSDTGVMLCAPGLSDDHREQLGIAGSPTLRQKLTTATCGYLDEHRRRYGYA